MQFVIGAGTTDQTIGARLERVGNAYFDVVRSPRYFPLWLGQLVSTFGDTLHYIALVVLAGVLGLVLLGSYGFRQEPTGPAVSDDPLTRLVQDAALARERSNPQPARPLE